MNKPKFKKGDRVITTEEIPIDSLFKTFYIPKGTKGVVTSEATVLYNNGLTDVYEYTVDLEGQEEIYLTEWWIDVPTN